MTPPAGKPTNITITLSKFIDTVMYWLHNHVMPNNNDVYLRMAERLRHECVRINEIRKDMEKLAHAYNRYIDLAEEQLRRERRMERIIGVFGPSHYTTLLRQEESSKSTPLCDGPCVDSQALRDELPLWEAMGEYLSYVSEARIGEMEEFFGKLETEFPHANRQAIESVLKRHPEIFKVRKNKREKFISLKEKAVERDTGGTHAASTKSPRQGAKVKTR